MAVASAVVMAACGDDPLAGGTLQVMVAGRDPIEDRIAAATVSDGWSIDFARFVIVVSDVSVGKSGRAAAFAAGASRVFDLAKPSGGLGHLLGSTDVAGGVYDRVAFGIAPPRAGFLPGNVSAAEAQAMSDDGLSLQVEGTAQKGGESIHFEWSFTTSVTYAGCATELKVDGASATATIALRGERLFTADAASATSPTLAFQAVADADADNDGDVTFDELEDAGLAAAIGARIASLGAVVGDDGVEVACELAP